MRQNATRPAAFSAADLIQLREELGISQAAMAARMEFPCSRSAILAWEKGINPITPWAVRDFLLKKASLERKTARAKARKKARKKWK